ncbi:MAG: FAD binding domain-containing protein [Anaerocolumna sp.]
MVGLYPENLKEAVFMKFNSTEAKLYAGGTDFMVRHAPCEKLLFLNQLQELKKIYTDKEYLYIGSCCTYIDLLNNDLIPEILKKAVRGIAAPAIKNAGTIGGNICNASPAGDTLPVLYALEAEVVLISVSGERILPVQEFILGVRKLAILDTEIVKEIKIPQKDFAVTYYQKVGARKSQALSKLSFAALADIKENRITDLRIAFGSVSTATVKRKDLEVRYTGLTREEMKEKLDSIQSDYNTYITPIDDQRSTAAYRTKICMNLLKDFITSL